MQQVLTNATPSNKISERELAHRELARKVAAESIVLLENNGVLPMAPQPVALFGAGAATTIKGGTGSGEVNERYSVTIEQGLQNAGFEIRSNAWLREYEQLLASSKKTAYKALAWRALSQDPDVRINLMADAFQYPVGRVITKEEIEKSDCNTCIYVVARLAGECSDRSLDGEGYYLAEAELENLRMVASSYQTTILVINVSGPLDLRPLDEIPGIGAVLFYCQQGMEGGNALANILIGTACPSGCLSSTWPHKYEDLPHAMEYSYLKGGSNIEEYKEGIYVGYRYFDSFAVAPRYAFGYGLSYTDFSVRCLGTSLDAHEVRVSVEVCNTGETYAGKKTVQLYASAPNGTLQREYQSLVAFAKTKTLDPGDSEIIYLSFSFEQLAGYDEEQACFLLEQGDYILRLGTCSRSTQPIAHISLSHTVITERCANVCKLEQDLAEITAPLNEPGKMPNSTDETAPTKNRDLDPVGAAASNEIIVDALQHLTLDASSLSTKEHCYRLPPLDLSPQATRTLENLDTQDLLDLVVTTGIIDNDLTVGVYGSAAYTTSKLTGKGVPSAALCDGPAGLRLCRTLVRQRNGRIKSVEPAFELLNYLPRFVRPILLGKAKSGTLLYQYTSAFPVGTALAQTWNYPLIEEVGDAIGNEMCEFGATFLLAPGMNIQRNPLCGRNYEYYSEDPLLTGKMAVAITKGVQKYPGCYVTLKHFAANNQETNRNRSNSVVGERTLREIYLKGFRMAVEEGGAKAVMTSYNLLNGVYTPNSYDLCTALLRCEWGFDGLVMTDWFSTDKGLAGNGLAIKAGNDLICPGGSATSKALKNDLDKGIVSVDELRLSASRVLEAVINGRTGMMAKQKELS